MSAFWGGFADTLLDLDKEKRTIEAQKKRDELLAKLQTDLEMKRQAFQERLAGDRMQYDRDRDMMAAESENLKEARRREEFDLTLGQQKVRDKATSDYYSGMLSNQKAAGERAATSGGLSLVELSRQAQRARADISKEVNNYEFTAPERAALMSQIAAATAGVVDPEAITRTAYAEIEAYAAKKAAKKLGVPDTAVMGR